MEKYEVVRDMIHGFDYRPVIEDIPAKRISGITQAMEFILGQDDGKKRYLPAVSALKERISTQINITPVSGGRSSLFGPSCTKVGGLPNG